MHIRIYPKQDVGQIKRDGYLSYKDLIFVNLDDASESCHNFFAFFNFLLRNVIITWTNTYASFWLWLLCHFHLWCICHFFPPDSNSRKPAVQWLWTRPTRWPPNSSPIPLPVPSISASVLHVGCRMVCVGYSFTKPGYILTHISKPLPNYKNCLQNFFCNK